MRVKLRIRAKARADLDLILEYSVQQHGEAAGERYIALIGAALDRLVQYPELGAIDDDLVGEVRSYPTGEHRIYYRLIRGHLSVARVLHKRMDVKERL